MSHQVQTPTLTHTHKQREKKYREKIDFCPVSVDTSTQSLFEPFYKDLKEMLREKKYNKVLFQPVKSYAKISIFMKSHFCLGTFLVLALPMIRGNTVVTSKLTRI